MIEMITTSTALLLMTAVMIAAFWLAVWSYRKFGITMFGWLVVDRAVDAILRLSNRFANPDEYRNVMAKVETLFTGNLFDASSFHITAKTAIPLLSTLMLVIYAAAEVAHFGPRLVEGFTAPPWLTRTYRLRHLVGFLAVLFAASYGLTIAWIKHFVP
jgi:hypothetical protein